jgi:hypothetical protein
VIRASVVLVSLALACGGSLVDRGARELCYAQAEQRAQASTDEQCGDQSFLECPAADAIMSALKSDQEACK